MTDRVATSPQIFRPDEMPFIERGNGARTIPLTTTAVGATSFLNGITTFEPGAEIAHHTHNCIESVMIIEGEAIVDIDGAETPLTTHDTTFVPANIPHRFKNASSEKRMRILWTYASADATRTLVTSGETGRIDAEQQSAESLEPVIEHVEIEVQPGSEDAFVAAAAEAAQHFQKTPGSRSFEVFTSHEQPSRMRVLIGWDSIAAHEHFRTTPEYAKWRELVGPHFAEAPRVEHLRSAHKAF